MGFLPPKLCMLLHGCMPQTGFPVPIKLMDQSFTPVGILGHAKPEIEAKTMGIENNSCLDGLSLKKNMKIEHIRSLRDHGYMRMMLSIADSYFHHLWSGSSHSWLITKLTLSSFFWDMENYQMFSTHEQISLGSQGLYSLTLRVRSNVGPNFCTTPIPEWSSPKLFVYKVLQWHLWTLEIAIYLITRLWVNSTLEGAEDSWGALTHSHGPIFGVGSSAITTPKLLTLTFYGNCIFFTHNPIRYISIMKNDHKMYIWDEMAFLFSRV